MVTSIFNIIVSFDVIGVRLLHLGRLQSLSILIIGSCLALQKFMFHFLLHVRYSFWSKEKNKIVSKTTYVGRGPRGWSWPLSVKKCLNNMKIVEIPTIEPYILLSCCLCQWVSNGMGLWRSPEITWTGIAWIYCKQMRSLPICSRCVSY